MVFRPQILTSKVDPHGERATIIYIDRIHNTGIQINQSELTKTFIMISECLVYIKMFQRFNGQGVLSIKKKIQKSVKNSDWPDNTHPPHYPIFNFLGNMYNNNNRKHKKHKIKKKKSELGLDPPTHFRVFPGFLYFFLT